MNALTVITQFSVWVRYGVWEAPEVAVFESGSFNKTPGCKMDNKSGGSPKSVAYVWERPLRCVHNRVGNVKQ